MSRRVVRRVSLILCALAVVALLAVAVFSGRRETVLTLGVYVGGRWDVPLEDSNQFFENLIQKFEGEHPGVRVEYKSGILKRDYSEWLAGQVLQDNLPDVFLILSSDLSYLISIGALERLDERMQADAGFSPEDFFHTALQEGRLHDSQYALAYEISPTLMFVNKSVLAQVGAEIPDNNWTWEQFYQTCQAVTDVEQERFGVYDYSWRDALYSNRFSLFNESGTEAYFDHPEMVEAIQFMQRMEALNASNTVTAEHFDNGQVAFRPFLFSSYKAYKPFPYSLKKYDNFQWECIAFPKGPNGSNASLLQSSLVGISSKSSHKALAWELVRLMTCDDEIQASILEYSYGIPSLKTVFQSESDVMKSLYDDDIWLNQDTLLEVIENSINEPSFQHYNAVMRYAEKEIYIIINSQTDAESALKKLNREINEMLRA